MKITLFPQLDKNKSIIVDGTPDEILKKIEDISSGDISTPFSGNQTPVVSKLFMDDTQNYCISINGKVTSYFSENRNAAEFFACMVVEYSR